MLPRARLSVFNQVFISCDKTYYVNLQIEELNNTQCNNLSPTLNTVKKIINL
jgi:hypothetical protein